MDVGGVPDRLDKEFRNSFLHTFFTSSVWYFGLVAQKNLLLPVNSSQSHSLLSSSGQSLFIP